MMRLLPKSLSARILIDVFMTSFIIIILLGGIIFSQTASLTKSLSQEKLVEQAKQIASFIEYDWRGRFEVDMPRSYRDYYAESSRHQYAVTNASAKKILFRSPGFMSNRIKGTEDKGGKYFFSFETEGGEFFSALKYDYLFEGVIYPIYVIEYEEEFSQFISSLQKDFIENIILLGLPLLFLQGLLIFIIFKSALKPVFFASKEVRKVKYDNLSFRLSEKGIHDEILPLIRAVNNSLSRLEKGAESQKFFIANAAHELRTPLSILKARIASLENERDVYMLNEDLRNINRLISQMLDISRLDFKEDIPMSEVNLNSVVQKACADIAPLYVEQNRDLSLQEKAKNILDKGNSDTLFRAFLNLLENALKYTPEGSDVDVIIEDMSVTIRDYGTPISDDHKSKIFERFEKLPHDANNKGSGLGLSIVKRAAEIHGGTIHIVSRKDGNDFVMDFGGAFPLM